jgi:hypothetical protein
VVGKIGRLSGRVAPGTVGEVMLPVRGGTEAFNAYSFSGEEIPSGTRVLVVEFEAPRDVYVAPFTG